MTRIAMCLAVALAMVAPAAAGDGIVHFKLLPESAVLFGPPTAACPAGTKGIDISSPAGSVVGRQYVCTQSAGFVDDTTLVEVNTVTWDFGNGDRLHADATAIFSFAGDFQTADFAAFGTITGGTGRYEGASGSLKAQGHVTFDELFEPHLNVNSIVKLD